MGDVAAARKTAEHIAARLQRGFALADIATVQAKAGDIAGAQATIRDWRPDDVSYAVIAIAAARAKAGDLAGAESTASSLGPGWEVEVLTALAEPQPANSAGAKSSAAKVREIVAKGDWSQWSGQEYRLVALAEAHAGEFAEAKTHFGKVRMAAATLDVNNDCFDAKQNREVMRAVGIAQAQTGDLDGVRATAEVMTVDRRGQAEVCRAIAAAEVRNGNGEAAELPGRKRWPRPPPKRLLTSVWLKV